MAKFVYMVVETDTMKVTQLGELNTITSKQFLENPEATIYTAPIHDSHSYTVFSIEQLQQMCKNEGIYEEGMAYVSMINVMRLHLRDKYMATKDDYKPYEWYEMQIAKAEKENPEYWAKFKPEPPKDIPDSFKRGGTARHSGATVNKSARPRNAGATGKVWEIADATKLEFPDVKDPKELRAEIIKRCVEDGINPATAATQFSKWKNTKEWH